MKIIYVIILLYTLWQVSPAFIAWGNTPHLYGSEWVFLIWLVPLIFLVFRHRFKKFTFPFFVLSILCALLGQLGSLKALSILSFPLCLAAFLPWRSWNLLWLVTSISWMPAIGYIGRSLPPEHLLTLRLLTATIGSFSLLYTQWRSDE